MLEYDKIDVREEVDLNKIDGSRERKIQRIFSASRIRDVGPELIK